MLLIYVRQAVIVEGRYDKIKLSSIIDGVIIATDGFRIYKDKEKCALIRHYAKTTGIIILTDSDSAGFQIRGYLKNIVGNESKDKIINVYIPDIFGKERRKSKPSKEGKLGVEGVDTQTLIKAFEKAGIEGGEHKENKDPITRADLYEDGLMGKPESTKMRRQLLKQFEFPELMSTGAMLDLLNSAVTREEYKETVGKLKKQ